MTVDESVDQSRSRGRKRKVKRLIDEYGLSEVGPELENRWTGTDDRKASLRELAAWFNRQLLQYAMEEAGMDPIADDVETTYNALTDETVSSGTRTQIRRRLERAGVDLDRLEADFVSRQAIHTYLTKDRGIEHRVERGNSVERDVATIRRLAGRAETVAQDKLERLRDRDELSLGDVRVAVDLKIRCRDCGTQLTLADVLDAGGCDCS